MNLTRIVDRFKSRAHRRAYRSMVEKWYRDGGDDKFRFDYDLGRDSLVMDLGGFQGQWASDLYSRYRCRVLVFEPVSAFAKRIEQRFRNNDEIEVFQLGLGAATRRETIYIRGAGSSTFRKRADTEEIQIVDIKDWFAEHGIGSVELMKINIEGGEFELLERMIATDLLAAVENIQVQFHNVSLDSAHRMESIQRGMLRTHEPTYQYRFVWENWKRKGDSVN